MSKDEGRFSRLDNPTAAYPVGTLGGSGAREARPGAPVDEPPPEDHEEFEVEDDLTDEVDDNGEYETARFWAPTDGRVHPLLLVGSLIVGGALALAVVALLGLVVLLG